MKPDTVLSIEYASCIRCGWPVVQCLSNDEFDDIAKGDYYAYCSNKGCPNHKGEDYGQVLPGWAIQNSYLGKYYIINPDYKIGENNYIVPNPEFVNVQIKVKCT